MEKDIGKIKKNETTDIIIRVDDFGGKNGVSIREFVTSDRYTGFTKSGTKIPADKFGEFKKMINTISEKDLAALEETKPREEEKESKESNEEEIDEEETL